LSVISAAFMALGRSWRHTTVMIISHVNALLTRTRDAKDV
jgi:hypothetical protein